MTRTRGLILLESLPSLFIASRIQARSTTAGTPVKSWQQNRSLRTLRSAYYDNFTLWTPDNTCKITRAGLKGISTCFGEVFSQSMIFSTSSLVTWKLSQLRIADSRRILMEYGNLSTWDT